MMEQKDSEQKKPEGTLPDGRDARLWALIAPEDMPPAPVSLDEQMAGVRQLYDGIQIIDPRPREEMAAFDPAPEED